MTKPRSIALVSGGLDSLVSLARAVVERDVRIVMFFDYGQRARASERVSAMSAANYYGLPFLDADVRWLESLSPSGMRSSDPDSEAGLATLDDVWIPNRNGVFINVAAAYAESYGCDTVVTGFNREEAEEFPDNSREYVERVNAALALSTRNRVRVESFTIDLDKRAIIRMGLESKAPLSIVWSCYRSGPLMCGRCASCARLRGAIDSLPPAERPVIEFADV
ncbi:MAG TPA: 7-cyano-7-deazaguanine synthase [Candidatus Krumholzibacteria bacterium]|nr:7-cyano-7-deazaguanine synthase [Candidatus Krumholzibacteria bacterium]